MYLWLYFILLYFKFLLFFFFFFFFFNDTATTEIYTLSLHDALPIDPRISRSLSNFDARHRIVLSYYWELPFQHYSGAKGKLLNGWAVSGITTFQTGFPIRIQSLANN